MLDLTPTRRSAILGAMSLTLLARTPAAFGRSPTGSAKADPAFINDLIAKMTIEEKVGQLTLMASAVGGAPAAALNPPGLNSTAREQIAQARAGLLTGVFNGAGSDYARQLQTAAMQSRLKIPVLSAADVIHGHRTIYPVPMAEAASFEPDLAERTARAAAVEAAAAGVDWTFAPMVDIARDARWGRGVEGSGEDPHLGSLMAAARVRGFQGKSLDDPESMMACAKHFAAYGAAEGGLDYNIVDISEQKLRNVYFPPFRAAFDAGCFSTMASFNEINGVPATANEWLLSEVLRDEWGFDGLVVSDYTGDLELVAAGYAADPREAAKLALLAGVDMSMESGIYLQHIPDLVARGEVPVEAVDRAVRRVLAVKARLGLFDDAFRRLVPGREKARSRTKEHLALARESGRRSIVLLKNEGDLLPLKRTGQKIALIGPFARGQHDLIGPWNVYGDDQQAVDLESGMRAMLGSGASLSVTDGSGVEEVAPGGIEAAVAAARAADIVVLAVGESQVMSGEAQSRTEVVLPAPQQALAEAVAATGKPIVVVLKNGRALALSGAVLNAPALLVTWFLGSETGPAIADVLFGAYSPSGRLPVSFPQRPGQEPFYYAHKATGRPNPEGPPQAYKAHYRGMLNEAAFPFGHGLTYSSFRYGAPQLDGQTLAWDGTLTVTATITNSGAREAEEVAQLYIHDRTASITRPVRELKAFRKLRLKPGASETVRFVLRREDLEFFGPDDKWTVEPGQFDLWIAPSSASGEAVSFTLAKA